MPPTNPTHTHTMNNTPNPMSTTYALVLWPESQTYMEEPWFEEHAILADCDAIGESQAYFIPIEHV